MRMKTMTKKTSRRGRNGGNRNVFIIFYA